MKRSLDDLLKGIPAQTGNGGKPPQPKGTSGEKRTGPETQLDRITAGAKRVLQEEADERAEKLERLKAAREARDKT
ncbi:MULTISPECIES: hypothetical protein [unclassified Salipiger]|uniref:hypothetical protein n=1 Tax=unclassified Salipiger TaxID=2640570 RepID=UPI0013BE692D|nr:MULTISPECIES: hypothetical protein [unclassified Salipiger]NDV51340.1 hypothetical protein [Salipiger sp. PrR003]NDW31775.1 hypothetical protein [Salipiger sp. PrR007]